MNTQGRVVATGRSVLTADIHHHEKTSEGLALYAVVLQILSQMVIERRD